MAIQPETVAGRKAYFNRKREAFVATWTVDENGIVHIPLREGFEGIFHVRHFANASRFHWHLRKTSQCKNKKRNVIKHYVEAKVVEELRPIYGRVTYLHRVITGVPLGLEVDHIDVDGLNCLDSNMRIATRGQNCANRRVPNSTGFRGVLRQPSSSRRPFKAQIEYEGVNHYLGAFRTAAEAGAAYDAEAKRVFGEFAILNFGGETNGS